MIRGSRARGFTNGRGEGITTHEMKWQDSVHDIIPAQQDSFKGSAFLKDNVMMNFGEKTAANM